MSAQTVMAKLREKVVALEKAVEMRDEEIVRLKRALARAGAVPGVAKTAKQVERQVEQMQHGTRGEKGAVLTPHGTYCQCVACRSNRGQT